ncbi:RNA recognition domain-containing protein [Phlyctema vagabunda]|uniref:RNA recognition domain-containing protein n=1 Tax=Phlyctema vagabunda TaxID=108571 RepID=A0ABR4PSH2_9HELO
MTPTEAPEFHTQPSTPLSPLPFHPPEPAKIPVLRNQIDPVLNMTSTFELHDEHAVKGAPTATTIEVADHKSPSDDASLADSSFSDAYNEQPEQTADATKVTEQVAEGEDEDDYAMTFDSEDEGQSEYHHVSDLRAEQETTSLAASVPASEYPSSVAIDSRLSDVLPLNGQDAQSTQVTSTPTHPAPAAATHSENSTSQPALQTSQPPSNTFQDVASGGIDIQQLLDNITANAENNTPAATFIPTPTAVTSSHVPPPVGGTSLTSHSSLPPRPQISSYRPPGVSAPLVAPGTSSDPRSGLPPPPSASFHSPPLPPPAQLSPAIQTPPQDRPAQSIENIESRNDADKRWSPAVQKLYDQFLSEERGYVAEGLWDRFPNGSRLFIGNLPSEKVTKRDLFHVFHKYGRLAQVSIKQAYGFIQFHDTASCYAALTSEQGTEVRGKKIHLEISKPQKNTRNAQKAAPPVRRSRSPEHQRNGAPDRGHRSTHSGGRGGDSYDGRGGQAGRDEYGRTLRARDDYRPGRSPSPPRGSYRTRDEYAARGRDPYENRRRSRSNSPYSHRDNGRYRERSPSPGARQAFEDADLQIPRRDPRDVPDVQVILLSELDRGFVSWVDGELRGRGIKSEIMFLSPRLPIQAVIRRQVLEGVLAVSQLDMRSQNSSKIPLQVFNRQAGANDVRFDEYRDLEPRIAAELVLRAKQTQVQAPAYSQPQYASPQAYQPPQPAPAPVAAAPDLVNLVGQLDNATLQRLLSALPQQQQQNMPAATANSGMNLAGILGGLNGQQGQQAQPTYPQLVTAANTYSQNAPSYPPPAQAQSAQQVQNIMAQLAKFRQ